MWKLIFYLENQLFRIVSVDQEKKKGEGESEAHKVMPQDQKKDAQEHTFDFQVDTAESKHSNSHHWQE